MAANKIVTIIKDRLLLIISAIAVGLGLFYFIRMLSHFGVTKQWELYIFGCLIYAVTTLYLIISFKKLRNLKLTSIILMIILLALPISFSYYFFHSGLIAMPDHIHAYSLACVILVPGTTMLFDWLSRNMKRKLFGSGKSKKGSIAGIP